MKNKRFFFLLLYYGVARYLPASGKPILGRVGKWLRVFCCRRLFKRCGRDINIEHMASFGDGHSVEIGDCSNIGIHCHVPNDILIGNYVMMGPYCFILDNMTHNFSRIDTPMMFQGMSRVNRRTVIGDDVWMGRQCLMIAGKHIGNQVVIGGGA